MKDFLDDYFNVKRMVKEKKEYRAAMERVKQLPEEYQFVFKKIQEHMWKFTSGAGYDMMAVQYDLLELFEQSVAANKRVLEVTGNDVAAFVEELLRNAKTYTQDWREKLNKEIHQKLGE